MNLPTWEGLITQHCTQERVQSDDVPAEENPFYEKLSHRRYNYSPSSDTRACRLVFLKAVLENSTNKTLCRHGRFIWCKNLAYGGRNDLGYRQIRFTVDSGSKKFTVAENNVLCLPSKVFVNNNRYFRSNHKIFIPFSSVFGYKNSLKMMQCNQELGRRDFQKLIEEDNPFKPGTLVAPRQGYFYPASLPPDDAQKDDHHPCGIILGRALREDYMGREFYRVRFAHTTYERVHPIQMEIINEV